MSIAGATVINMMLLLRNLQPVGNLTHLGKRKTSPKQIVFCVITEVETKRSCERFKEITIIIVKMGLEMESKGASQRSCL